MEHLLFLNLIGWLLRSRTIKLNSFTHHLYWKKNPCFVNLLDNCSSVHCYIVNKNNVVYVKRGHNNNSRVQRVATSHASATSKMDYPNWKLIQPNLDLIHTRMQWYPSNVKCLVFTDIFAYKSCSINHFLHLCNIQEILDIKIFWVIHFYNKHETRRSTKRFFSPYHLTIYWH